MANKHHRLRDSKFGRVEMQKKIYFTHNKENSIHNNVSVLMFQQLLANKHYRLRDSKFGRVEV